MENLTKINVQNREFIIVVLENSGDFSTETNDVYLVPVRWAEDKKLESFQSNFMPIHLKEEMDSFKIQNIHSFYNHYDTLVHSK